VFNTMAVMKKRMPMSGEDEAIYGRTRSAAALQGVSMGLAVTEALRG